MYMNDPKYQEVDVKPFLRNPTAAKGKIIEMKEYCMDLKDRSDVLLKLLDSITQLMSENHETLFTDKLPVATQLNVYRHLAENDVENLKIVMSRVSAVLADVSDILENLGRSNGIDEVPLTTNVTGSNEKEISSVEDDKSDSPFRYQYEMVDTICTKLKEGIQFSKDNDDPDAASFIKIYYDLFIKFKDYCVTSDLTPEQLLSTIGISLPNLYHSIAQSCWYAPLLSINTRQLLELAQMCHCDVVIAHHEKRSE